MHHISSKTASEILKKSTKCDPKDIRQFLMLELKGKDEEFPKRVELFYVQLVQWIVKMNSDALFDNKL
jgi:hypothetical protein